MKVREFLQQISDGEGPMHMLAIDVVERMTDGEFRELAEDMQAYVDDEANTWAKDIAMNEVKI